MARFRTHAAVYVDGPAVGRIRAGRTVADSPMNALPGDVVWIGLTSANLPAGFVPLDALATSMRNASVWAGQPFPATILGCDSVDG